MHGGEQQSILDRCCGCFDQRTPLKTPRLVIKQFTVVGIEHLGHNTCTSSIHTGSRIQLEFYVLVNEVTINAGADSATITVLCILVLVCRIY